MSFLIRSICMAAGAFLAACASNIDVRPVAITPSTGPSIEIAQNTEILLATGYHRLLARSSRWREVGRLPEGLVYSPVGTVFSIEGRHVHEAYLVLSAERGLVGFYLPGERNFSPLSNPQPVPLKEIP